MNRKSLIRICALGVFSALSIVLVYLIHLPIFPSVSFLEYDPADIPIIICSYLFGPFYGLIMTVVVSVIQGLTVSAQSGWVGIVMHIFATGSLVLVNSGLRLLLHKRKVRQGVHRVGVIEIISAFAGITAMTISMALWNLLFTPFFMGVTIDVIIPLLPFIILFNLIKATVNTIMALAIYRLIPLKILNAGTRDTLGAYDAPKPPRY